MKRLFHACLITACLAVTGPSWVGGASAQEVNSNTVAARTATQNTETEALPTGTAADLQELIPVGLGATGGPVSFPPVERSVEVPQEQGLVEMGTRIQVNEDLTETGIAEVGIRF